MTIGANGTSSINATGISYVDVTITSDTFDSSNNPVPVSLFGYYFNFKITSAGGSKLEFADPADTGYFIDKAYVFYSNSSNDPVINFPPQVDPNPGTGYGAYQRITGSDNTADFSDVSVTGPVLLTRLAVVSSTGAPIAAGDTFDIDSFTYSPPGGGSLPETSFSNSNLDPISFSVPTGVLTVAASAAVPEPAPLIIAASGLICLFALRVRAIA